MPRIPKLSKKDLATQSQLESMLSQSSVEPVIDTNSGETDPDYAQISPQEVQALDEQVKLEEKFGDQPVKAAALGAARGLTFGLSDQVLVKGFKVDPKIIKEIKERNEAASLAGEVIGIAAPAIASGGTSLAAEGISAAGAGVEAVGGLSKLVGKSFANLTERKIAKQIIEKSVANAAEGAAFGAGQLVSENALGDADLTAENLVAHAGPGAVLGGLMGGAFGAFEAAAPRVKTAIDATTGQFKRSAAELLDPREASKRIFTTNPTVLSKMEEKGFGEDALDYLNNGIKFTITDSKRDLLKKHEMFSKEVKSSLDDLYKIADDQLGAATSNKDFYGSLRKDLRAEISEGSLSKYKDAEGYLKQWKTIDKELAAKEARSGSVSFSDMRQLKQRFGEEAFTKYGTREETVKGEMFAKVWKDTSDQLNKYLDERIAASGRSDLQGLGNSMKDLNRKSSFIQFIDPHFRKNVERNLDINSIHEIALFAGGVFIGSPVKALSLIATRRFLNSDLKNKMIVLNSAWRANKEADVRIAQNIKNFLTGKSIQAADVAKVSARQMFLNSGFAHADRKAPKTEKEAFQNIQKNLVQFRVNPDLLALKIASSTLKAGYAAPNATKFAQVTMAKAVDFLTKKMPRNMNAGSDLIGDQDKKWEPSSLDMAKFQRYVQIVENPYLIFSELKKGTITREHIEALQEVYPAIYSKIRSQLLNTISSEKVQLPYNKKIQLGILLNAPVDSSMLPESIMNLQTNFAPSQPAQSGTVNSTQSGVSKLNMSDRSQTEVQKISQGVQE